MSNNICLTVTGISIRRAGRQLVEPFTWSYCAGGVAWLFGSNGSGKSSLLRVLAGLGKPSRGTVNWSHNGDRLLYHAPNQHVPADVCISDFITFASSVCSNAAPDQLVDQLFPSTVESHRRFKTLSTGEAKRLMLWGMLRQGDGPLVLDEPYEHLSRDVKPALTELLHWIASRTPVIVATNQDIKYGPRDSVLTLDGSIVEVRDAMG